MRHIVPQIWEEVESDIKGGNAINLDAYCAKYCAMRPELRPETIREIVLAAAASFDNIDRPKSRDEPS